MLDGFEFQATPFPPLSTNIEDAKELVVIKEGINDVVTLLVPAIVTEIG